MYTEEQKKEYLARRERDNQRTQIIEKFVDKIYTDANMQMQRVTDRRMQTKGVDIIHTVGSEKRYVDEKFAIQYYNKDLYTFAFELSSKNNKNGGGWFLSEHMITTHYAILWFKADDDFTKIYSYDLCYIPKQKIKDYLHTVGYDEDTLHNFENYWEWKQYVSSDSRYYEKNNRRYLKLRDGVKIVQSMQFEVESPINVVIPREKLYELSDHHFHSDKCITL